MEKEAAQIIQNAPQTRELLLKQSQNSGNTSCQSPTISTYIDIFAVLPKTLDGFATRMITRKRGEYRSHNYQAGVWMENKPADSEMDEVFSSQTGREFLEEFAKLPFQPPKLHKEVTRRQNEIIEMVKKGYTNSVIAKELDISPKTVKMHLQTLFEKFGVHNKTQLAAVCESLELTLRRRKK